MLTYCKLCQEHKTVMNHLEECLDCGLHYTNITLKGKKCKIPTIIFNQFIEPLLIYKC